MEIKGVFNPLPTLTWNFLDLNGVGIDETVKLNNRGDLVIQDLPNGVTVEKDGSLLDDVQGGVGPEMENLMKRENVPTLVIRAQKGKTVSEPICLDYKLGEGDGLLRKQEIIAEEGSEITVIMNYTSKRNESGFFGIQTKLKAEAGATIHLVKTNLLGDQYLHFDDIGAATEDDAHIDIIQMELGGGRNFIGVQADLYGRKSRFDGNVGYLTRGTQLLDMNYNIRHHGKKSESELVLNGAMMDKSVKNFRGTINLIRGAKGAVGDEQENVLLLSKDVHNKSLPNILCSEEDVEGTHGATIGRLSEDMLFYMESRGISEREAEILMTKARLNNVNRMIQDVNTLGRIQQFIEEVL